LLDAGRADAGDGVEVVDRGERPVLGAVVDDLLRGDRPDAGELIELFEGRRRQAHERTGRADCAARSVHRRRR